MMFWSVLGVTSTLFLSIPSTVYRTRVEDKLLREKFGEHWEDYAEKVASISQRYEEKMWTDRIVIFTG